LTGSATGAGSQFLGYDLRNELEQRIVDRTTERPRQHRADPWR
jgi:hypothetical protein